MTDNDSATSLRDDLVSAIEAPAPEQAPIAESAPPAPIIPAELPPIEPPSVWGAKYRETFQKVAQTPESREIAENWLNQWKETQAYQTKRDQEYAEYRKQLDPLREVISPYEGYWKMQGMDSRQGLTQILSYAEELARNPRSMIPELAKMYGVDLQELIAEQPYVDPMVAQLQQELQALKGQTAQYGQQQQQQMYNRLAEEIKSFETAVDEKGELKHPYFPRVFDKMVGIAKGGLASTIQDAYEYAISLDKDLQAEISAKRASEEAVTRAAEAKKAIDASRTVKSKAAEVAEPPQLSIRDELVQQLTAAGMKT